ncbi:MAG: hydroxymethylglutaryl-CoA lyase, partial [Chitinophagaceae bacterium]
LLAIVANTRGASEALQFGRVTQLGFPFSVSPSFQLRNTNRSMEESLTTVDEIQNLCTKTNKELVLYLSMAFGNPYGEIYNADQLLGWADQMVQKNIRVISLADTVGVAQPNEIASVFSVLKKSHSKVSFGVHLHSSSRNWKEKLDAAYRSGCRRFDGALLGIGGCPMANDDLVGNMATENIIDFLTEQGEQLMIDQLALKASLKTASEIFSAEHV